MTPNWRQKLTPRIHFETTLVSLDYEGKEEGAFAYCFIETTAVSKCIRQVKFLPPHMGTLFFLRNASNTPLPFLAIYEGPKLVLATLFRPDVATCVYYYYLGLFTFSADCLLF